MPHHAAGYINNLRDRLRQEIEQRNSLAEENKQLRAEIEKLKRAIHTRNPECFA